MAQTRNGSRFTAIAHRGTILCAGAVQSTPPLRALPEAGGRLAAPRAAASGAGVPYLSRTCEGTTPNILRKAVAKLAGLLYPAI